MVVTKNIMMETKEGSTGTKLLDQGLKLLFIMHTKRSFNGKNIFMLPTGASGKKYIDEATHLYNLWVNNTP